MNHKACEGKKQSFNIYSMNYRKQRLRQLLLDSASLEKDGIYFDFDRLDGKDYTHAEKAVAEWMITDETPYLHECLKIMNFVNAFFKVYPSIYYLHHIKTAFLYYKDTQELFYIFVDEMNVAVAAMQKMIIKF